MGHLTLLCLLVRGTPNIQTAKHRQTELRRVTTGRMAPNENSNCEMHTRGEHRKEPQSFQWIVISAEDHKIAGYFLEDRTPD